MKKSILRTFSVCTVLILLCSMVLLASADGIQLGVTVETTAEKITVTTLDTSDAANTILATEKPTLTVACEFASAYVVHNQQVVKSTLDTTAKTIQFQVAHSGVYEVLPGTAPATYTVTFHANGHGTAPAAVTALGGSKIAKPTDPTETGFAFGGWYREAACTNAWNFDTATVTENTTLYAKWTEVIHTVSFSLNGHGATTPPAQNIREGGKVSQPSPAPTAEGYLFRGWYTDAACSEGKMWNFNTGVVTEPMTLYAKWVQAYTVTFHANGHGTAPSTQTVDKDETARRPKDPTAEGWTFGGWYKDTACTEPNKWNFTNDLVTANTNLYAKWTPVTYTVTFHLNGVTGTAPEAQTVNHGTAATEPTAPTASGFKFGGWYTKPTCNESEKWNFSTTITADLTLYAKWTIVPVGSEDTGDRNWYVDDDDAGSLNPQVSGLSIITVPDSSGSASDDIEVILKVKSLSTSDVPTAEKDAIKAAAHGRDLSYLGMTLTKKVNGVAKDIGDSNAVILAITLDFDTTDRHHLCVYRYHDKSVDTLPQTTNNLVEGFSVSGDGKQITIYARKFSTYAIGYCTGNDKPDSTITEVTVSPSSTSMRKGTSKTFTAAVTGTEDFDNTVEWSVSGNKSTSTKIDKDGKLTIASGETARTLTVKATSKQDKTKSDTATVTVTKDTSSANTGDQFNPIVWIGLMALCVAGVVVLIILKKKR